MTDDSVIIVYFGGIVAWLQNVYAVSYNNKVHEMCALISNSSGKQSFYV